MRAMTDAIAWMADHGYPIIFLTLLVSGLGVPIPEDVPLIAAGILADHGGLPVPIASLACGVFVLSRDSIVFTLGYRYGANVLENRWASRIVKPEQLHRAEAYLEKHGALVVFIGRFVPGFRAAIFFAAGASKVRPLVFIVTDALAALISLPFFIWIGFKFSQNMDRIQQAVSQFRAVSIGIIVLIVGVAVWRWWRGRKAAA